MNQNPRNPGQAADHDTILDKNRPLVSLVPDMEHLLLILREDNLNWFAFVVKLRTLLRNYSEETLLSALTDVSNNLKNRDLTDEEKFKVEMSKQAYLNMRDRKQWRMIVTLTIQTVFWLKIQMNE